MNTNMTMEQWIKYLASKEPAKVEIKPELLETGDFLIVRGKESLDEAIQYYRNKYPPTQFERTPDEGLL